MAVPFRRTGKTAKRLRRTHFKVNTVSLISCPSCGAKIKPHTVCPNCGQYKGIQVQDKQEVKE